MSVCVWFVGFFCVSEFFVGFFFFVGLFVWVLGLFFFLGEGVCVFIVVTINNVIMLMLTYRCDFKVPS